MRMIPVLAAGLISVAAVATPASAQRRHHGGHHDYWGRGAVQHRTWHGRHYYYYGPWRTRWAGSRTVCDWHWRHHHRYRVCRRIYS